MATFTAGTSFTDGVTGDVTAAKLNALVANATPLHNLITDRTAETSVASDDLVLISDTSDSAALNKMTVANLMKAELTGTINSTAGTIATLNSTTGTIPTLTSTTLLTTGTGTAASPAIVPTGDTNTGIFFPAADTIAATTNGTERFRIDSSGNVGIGTTSPASKLHVSGSSGTGSEIRITSTTINNGGKITFYESTSSAHEIGSGGANNYFYIKDIFNNAERLRITSGGVVLIGATSTPSSSVSGVSLQNPFNAGSTFSLGSYTGSATVIGFVNGNGTIGSISVNGSATAYNTSSDYRLKTNLESISSGIDRIKQLPVYRFNWIADESGNKVDGFVAHEAQAVVPECVTGEKDAVDADGNPIYQGIDQSKIVPLLTAALKEAIAKIETLESKVAALEAA